MKPLLVLVSNCLEFAGRLTFVCHSLAIIFVLACLLSMARLLFGRSLNISPSKCESLLRISPANLSSRRPPRAPEPHPDQRQEMVLPANNHFSRQVRIFLLEQEV